MKKINMIIKMYFLRRGHGFYSFIYIYIERERERDGEIINFKSRSA
jgi:hypothetical protein